MATYAIGDVQGCFSALHRLVDAIRFDPAQDRLWFVGDLVNRGPDSLAVLRWVKGLGESAVTILGNHDLHLLAVADGIAPSRPSDTLQDVLVAPDRHELLEWLTRRPLIHVHDGFFMVHAGLLPQWTVDHAVRLAGEVEHALQGPTARLLLEQVYQKNGNASKRWNDHLVGLDRLGIIIKVMTRLRICDQDGRMNLSYKGPLPHVPKKFMPWFRVPGRKSADVTVICGHWAALGLHVQENLLAIDSGCVWGGHLTAVRLENRQVFQVSCEGARVDHAVKP